MTAVLDALEGVSPVALRGHAWRVARSRLYLLQELLRPVSPRNGAPSPLSAAPTNAIGSALAWRTEPAASAGDAAGS